MFGLFGKKAKTRITSINIRLQGATHQIPGVESSEKAIEIRIPFKNKVHSDMLTDAGVFKAQEGKPISIKEIKVSDPFVLASVDPKPPLEIKSGDSIEFRLSVGVPDHNYSGPLTVSFEAASEEVIHLEIARTILDYKGKKTEIESSARMLNLQKNGILVEKVQMMKAMGFGDTVSGAEAAFPFKIVSTDPKLPVKIDQPNGYIMAFYIQAPDHSYSGDLEIKVL
jgi:hypothetical protein